MGVGNSLTSTIYPDSESNQIKLPSLDERAETDLSNISAISTNDDSFEEDESFIGKHSLRFNQTCGKNIRFSCRNRLAERKERTFCDAIVFSNRPVAINERVNIRIVKQSSNWNGIIKFGFTSLNPIQFNSDPNLLPKYVYPDMTNRKGCWAASMLENAVQENDTVYFYVTHSGEIHFGINDKYQGVFLDGVEVFTNGNMQSLWAIFDIYGNTTAIELLKISSSAHMRPQSVLHSTADSLSSLSSSSTLSAGSNDNLSLNATLQSHSLNTSTSIGSSLITVIPNRNFRQTPSSQPNRIDNDAKLERLLVTFRRLCVDNHLNETLHNSILESSLDNHLTSRHSSLKMRNFYSTVPVLFHESFDTIPYFRFISKCHGKTVKISQPDSLLAYRDENIINRTQLPTRNAYVFLDKPLEVNQSLCIQVVGIDQRSNELKMSLGIGCTTCQPDNLNATYDLPDDADDFLERPEYWIVYKNIFNNIKQASLADELCFKLDKLNGDLDFYINGVLIKKCLFNVDITQKLWFFFDLCGKTNAIRLIPSCNLIRHDDKTSCNGRGTRPNSALIELYKNQILGSDEVDQKSARKTSSSSNKDECRICWEAPIECVFNTCGHMCVCFNCATDLKNHSLANYNARQEMNRSNATFISNDSNDQMNVSKNPLCPICRKEITDIIRFFKA